MSRVADALARTRDQSGPELSDTRATVKLPLEDYPTELRGGERGRAPSSIAHALERSAAPDRSLGERVSSAPLVVSPDGSPIFVEQYRRLAGTLYQGQRELGLKRVMVCSALPGEGKTVTTANVALTLSGTYEQRVLLIDADLRNPTQHRLFDIPNSKGLGNHLVFGGELPVVQVSPGLHVVPAGPPNPNPIGALVSERMRLLMEAAAQRFDWVLLDTPPVTLLPDANLLASLADGLVLVVAASSTSYKSVQRAIATVGADRVIGIVLNKAPLTLLEHEAYYPYYHPDPGRR